MTPAFTHLDANLYLGDCLEVMRTMPDASVQCCITSPPYYGLRDYGCDGQIGLEPNLTDYIDNLVNVFAEVRRVLRDDGTLWCNMGDSYFSDTKGSGGKKSFQSSNAGSFIQPRKFARNGLKPKDLMGVPWRLALALQDDGWYLRQDIIWNKPNPMPESITDRCTKSHEYIFLLSKSGRYYYDNVAIKEPSVDPESYKPARKRGADKRDGDPFFKTRVGNSAEGKIYPTRNKRSVWTVNVKPFKSAHFATFPIDLIEPCVLAGTAPGDTIIDPFNGAGTTGVVSLKHGRKYIGIELNPDYLDIAAKRIKPHPHGTVLPFTIEN